MALPKHKTTLSILRSALGPGAGNETRFAQKIGRSTSWLRKACCGQIPLMREAALAIAYETGISIKWLMDGNTAKPPVDTDGEPYTAETYARHRTTQREGFDREDADISQQEMVGTLLQLVHSYTAAQQKNRGGFFTFKLIEFAHSLADEFGQSKGKKTTAASIASALLHLIEAPAPEGGGYKIAKRKTTRQKPQPSRRQRKTA
jgi:hypothetical protein